MSAHNVSAGQPADPALIADDVRANPDPGAGIMHQFDCTHDPCECVSTDAEHWSPPAECVVALEVWRDHCTGQLQLAIDDGTGGYRIAGPSFCGDSKMLLRHVLNERDVTEIRHYLERTDG